MRPHAKRITLVLGATVALALVAWAFLEAARAFRELRAGPSAAQLAQARHAYLRLAERTVEAAITSSSLLLQHWHSNDPRDLAELQSAAREFGRWLAQERTNSLGGKILVTYPTTLTIDVRPVLDEVTEVNAQLATDPQPTLASTRRLFALASHARARAETIEQFTSLHSNWQHSYHRLVLITVAMLLGVSGWIFYRIWLIPRRKLIESAVVIERQQKLAHFGELAAGLAHEIRNPLTAINARLFTLKKALPAQSPASDDTAVIHGEINRLDRIVNEFLKLARPAEPRFATVQARPLFEEVSRLLAPSLKEHSIELKLDAALDDSFRADPSQLKQVLINLVQNAAEAIHRDGVITLSARIADRKLQGDTQRVVILEVRDTGPGIKPDAQKHLFDPFFSTKEDGTGLGLSISQRIVDQHGGEIECHTELGRGTTFGIVLPAGDTRNEA